MAFAMRAQSQAEEAMDLWMSKFIESKYPDLNKKTMNFCMVGDELRSYSKEWREMDDKERQNTGARTMDEYITNMINLAKEIANNK